MQECENRKGRRWKSMVNSCVAAGCTNKHKDGVSLFKFPKDPVLRKQWTDRVKRTRGSWSGPTEHSVLCSAHFTEDCIERPREKYGISQRPTLKKDAVPTIFKRPRALPCSSRQCSDTVTMGSEAGPREKKRRTAFEKRCRQRVSLC